MQEGKEFRKNRTPWYKLYVVYKAQLTLLKHARTLGTPSLGPSIPGIKSILGPIQLKGLTMVNSRPFSAPSAIKIISKKIKKKKVRGRILQIYTKRKKVWLQMLSNITINQPFNQLLCTGIRPPLFLDGTKNAWRLVFFEDIERGVLFHGENINYQNSEH